jgi:hypothetical protein
MTSEVNELAEVRLTSTSVVKRYVVVYPENGNYELLTKPRMRAI